MQWNIINWLLWVWDGEGWKLVLKYPSWSVESFNYNNLSSLERNRVRWRLKIAKKSKFCVKFILFKFIFFWQKILNIFHPFQNTPAVPFFFHSITSQLECIFLSVSNACSITNVFLSPWRLFVNVRIYK